MQQPTKTIKDYTSLGKLNETPFGNNFLAQAVVQEDNGLNSALDETSEHPTLSEEDDTPDTSEEESHPPEEDDDTPSDEGQDDTAHLLVMTPLEIAASGLSTQQIIQEIESLTRLNNENIAAPLRLIHTQETEEQKESFVLIREYVEGRSLIKSILLVDPFEEQNAQHEEPPTEAKQHDAQDEVGQIIFELSQSNRQPRIATFETRLQRTKNLLRGILQGLDYLHRYKRFHGALCSTNVFVDQSYHARIAEAGLWSILKSGEHTEHSDATPELVQRTDPSNKDINPYRAPELFLGEPPSAASDIYSLGCLVYEALAGVTPFGVEDNLAQQHLESTPTSLLEHQPHCPTPWVQLVNHMLHKIPEERISLKALLEHLEDLPTAECPFVVPQLVKPNSYCGRPETIDTLHAIANEPHDAMYPIILSGATGQGKHYFVDHLSHQLSREGWLVFRGRSYAHAYDPYQSWHLLIEDLYHIVQQAPELLEDEVGSQLAMVHTLFPEQMKGLRDEPHEHTEVQRLEAANALREVFDYISQHRPLLLAFDDLHLATKDSMELLQDILAIDSDFNGMLLITTDKEHQDILINREEEQAQRLLLRPLNHEEAHALLNMLATQEQRPLLGSIVETMSDPAPQLIKELIHELQHCPKEEIEEQAAHLMELARTSKQGELLSRLLVERYQKITDELELNILRMLSLHAGAMTWRTIQESLRFMDSKEPSSTMLDTAIKQLTRQRLLKRIPSKRTSFGAYRIASETCRQVIHAEMDSETTMLMHSALSKSLALPEHLNHIVVFEHARRAKRIGEAKRIAGVAREQARRILAFSQATEIQSWLVSQRKETGEEQRQELAELETASGQHKEAALLWEKIAEEHKDIVEWLQATCEASEAWFYAGKFEQAQALQGRGLQEFKQRYQPQQRRYRLNVFKHLWSTWAERIGDELITQATTWDEPTESANVQSAQMHLYTLILQCSPWMNTGHAPTFQRRLKRLALSQKHRGALAQALLHQAKLAVEVDLGSARYLAPQYLEQALRLSVTQGRPGGQAEIIITQARLATCSGEWTRARALYSSAEELWKMSNATRRMVRVELDYQRGLLALSHVDITEAQRLEDSLFYEERHLMPAQIRGHQLATIRALLEGHISEVALHLHEVAKTLPQEIPSLLHIWHLENQANFHIMCGEPEVAAGLVKLLWEKSQREALYRMPRVRARLQLKLAQSLAAQLTRDFYTDRPQRKEHLATMRSLLKQLIHRKMQLSYLEQEALARLKIRYCMLANKPRKGLKLLNRLGENTASDNVSTVSHLARIEIRAWLQLELDLPQAQQLMDEASRLYREHHIQSPLVLEGWPPLAENCTLKEDDATSS